MRLFTCPCSLKIICTPNILFFLSPGNTKTEKREWRNKAKRYDQKYDDAEGKKPILISESGMISFTRHFKYLGSYISYSLKYNYDIEHIISQASSAMGALNNFWIDNTVNNLSKYLIFCAIPCDLVLWGCESLEIREATSKKLEVFLHINVSKILNITITMVIDERITNQSLQK